MKQFMMGLALCLALAGCNHSSQDPTATGSTNPTSQSGNGNTAEAHPFGQSAVSQVDRSTPLSNYTKADDPSWLTYVYVSRLTDQLSDEEKMKAFSPKYFNESDAFKKHDIMVSDLPKVNDTLAKYKAQNYYVFQSQNPFAAGMAILSPYDFKTQSFHIANCGKFAFQGNQGVNLKLNPTDAMCNLKVTDANEARAIENLRAHFQLNVVFTTYFFVDGIEPARSLVDGTITHLHVDFQGFQQNQPVASLDIN